MLKQLYLIRDTGQCIYHQALGQLEVVGNQKHDACDDHDRDPNLISGFFAAVISFANHVVGKENEVNNISLKNSNFYFIKRKNFHYVLETDLINPNFVEEDFYTILNKMAVLIELYIKENNVDDSMMVISGEEDLCESVSHLISDHIRGKILSKLSFSAQV